MRPPATIVSLVGILLLSGSFAATWVVDPGGGGDATTIQGGVDLASGGDEVLIQPGTYGEEVAVPVPLTLRGVAGREATVIDAEDVRPFCLHLGANAGGSLVEGLTLTGVNGGYGYCTGVSAMNIACDATVSS